MSEKIMRSVSTRYFNELRQSFADICMAAARVSNEGSNMVTTLETPSNNDTTIELEAQRFERAVTDYIAHVRRHKQLLVELVKIEQAHASDEFQAGKLKKAYEY